MRLMSVCATAISAANTAVTAPIQVIALSAVETADAAGGAEASFVPAGSEETEGVTGSFGVAAGFSLRSKDANSPGRFEACPTGTALAGDTAAAGVAGTAAISGYTRATRN